MRDKTNLVVTGLVVMFLALAASFVFRAEPEGPVRGNTPPARPVSKDRTPPAFAKVAPDTVRITAARLAASGGDASILDCYACHDEKKPPELKFTDEKRLIFPKEHADLILMMANCTSCHAKDTVKLEYAANGDVVMPPAHGREMLEMAHGRNNRNNSCYNCHSQSKLNELVTKDGSRLKFDQAVLLCASCHGPTYDDWEKGMHGRTNGYWDKTMGQAERQDCNACHDPHAPAFPKMIPLPPPPAVRIGDRAVHAPSAPAEM